MRLLRLTVAAVAATLALTACGAPSAPEVQVSAIPSASATPTPSPTPTADPGTRANPLAIGDSLRLSSESVWTVGASADTVVGDGYVVLPIYVAIDWEATAEQGNYDPNDEGVDISGSLYIEYVTADGRSYDRFDTSGMAFPDPVENELWELGVIYPPGDSITANVGVTVPADEIPGGLWRVANSGGDGVFIVGAP